MALYEDISKESTVFIAIEIVEHFKDSKNIRTHTRVIKVTRELIEEEQISNKNELPFSM